MPQSRAVTCRRGACGQGLSAVGGSCCDDPWGTGRGCSLSGEIASGELLPWLRSSAALSTWSKLMSPTAVCVKDKARLDAAATAQCFAAVLGPSYCLWVSGCWGWFLGWNICLYSVQEIEDSKPTPTAVKVSSIMPSRIHAKTSVKPHPSAGLGKQERNSPVTACKSSVLVHECCRFIRRDEKSQAYLHWLSPPCWAPPHAEFKLGWLQAFWMWVWKPLHGGWSLARALVGSVWYFWGFPPRRNH